MQRKASATWKGGLKAGSGDISTESKTLSHAAYSFGTRFEHGTGTNPEELVAAAHAACFSMALSAELEKRGAQPTQIATEATATLENLPEGWRVTSIQLDVVGEVASIDEKIFQSAADEAKKNCPISRLLHANITMSAKLRQKAA